jgi:hypothetical protein
MCSFRNLGTPLFLSEAGWLCPLNAGQKAHVHLSSYLTTQEDERDREREAKMKERLTKWDTIGLSLHCKN